MSSICVTVNSNLLLFFVTLLVSLLTLLVLLVEVFASIVRSSVPAVVGLVVRDLIALHLLGRRLWREFPRSVCLRPSWRL